MLECLIARWMGDSLIEPANTTHTLIAVAAATMLTMTLLPGRVATAEETSDVAGAPAEFSVAHDPAAGTASVRAHDAVLIEILRELSLRARFELNLLRPSDLREHTSLDLEDVAVDKVLEQLLHGFSKVLVYDGAERGSGPGRVAKVFVLTRKQATPASETPPSSESSESPAGASNPEPGVAAAVDEFVLALDDPDSDAFAVAVKGLKEIAPERGVEELESRLNEPVESDDRNAPSEISGMRVRAAWGLGLIGSVEAFDALATAFNGSDPDVRQAAADSLAQLDGEVGIPFLVEVGGEGGDDERQTAANTALDVVEERPTEGAGCLDPSWSYPSCSRRAPVQEAAARSPTSVEEPGDQSLSSDGSRCLNSGWQLPSCSREQP